jgi:polynucleotide 5'-kinase involved in rRNA processing
MNDISDVGHILIYGPTYSGKTYFCKYLIEQY